MNRAVLVFITPTGWGGSSFGGVLACVHRALFLIETGSGNRGMPIIPAVTGIQSHGGLCSEVNASLRSMRPETKTKPNQPTLS